MYFTRVADPQFNKTLIHHNTDQRENLSYGRYYRLLSNIYSQIAGQKVASPSRSEFNQDIWVARKTGDFFEEVSHPGYPLNNALPNSVCSIFPDENALIVINQFPKDGGMEEGFSYVKMSEDGYLMPEPLNIYRFREDGNSVNLSMSRDAEFIFLSLKRIDGTGDQDIYLCIRVAKDLWSRPWPLEKGINTPYRETTPFITKDTKRLYFASNRGNANGNTDIYFSDRLDHTFLNWSEPQKLPYPINTEFNESQPFLDIDEKYIYFTSTRDGSSDIFRAEIRASEYLKNPITVNLRIINSENNYPTRGELRWGAAHKKQYDEFFRTYTGYHQLQITKNEPFRIQAKKRGFTTEEIVLNPKELLAANITTHELDIAVQRGQKSPVKKDLPIFGTKSKITLRNIYFEKSKDLVLPTSFPQLEDLAKVLRENPEIYISIEGHTDNVGSKKDLLDLSYDRANAIKKFLMRKLVNPVRISTVGFGDERPLNNNSTESDRERNRRVEVRIIRK